LDAFPRVLLFAFLAGTLQESYLMQITSPALPADAYVATKTTMQKPIGEPSSISAPVSTSSRAIDFSNITPRRLHAYLDEMIMSERMDIDDGSALFNSLPRGWYADYPDVPMDLRSTIKGIMEFARDNGFKPLAAYYAGLMDRMKLMEAQGLPISVVA
jgi:hypothetical protein